MQDYIDYTTRILYYSASIVIGCSLAIAATSDQLEDEANTTSSESKRFGASTRACIWGVASTSNVRHKALPIESTTTGAQSGEDIDELQVSSSDFFGWPRKRPIRYRSCAAHLNCRHRRRHGLASRCHGRLPPSRRTHLPSQLAPMDQCYQLSLLA